MEFLLLWVAVVALFGVGLLGTIVPFLPGIALVYGGVVLYAAATGFREVSVPVTLGLGGIALAAWLATVFGPAAAVRRSGGRARTVGGTLIGMLLGLTLAGPFGFLAGAFVGALIGALNEGRTAEQAAGIAGRSVVGVIAGTLLQFVLALVLIGAFFVAMVF
jgi:uncharacterized protein YqgC (DUF456 family)